MYVNVPLPEQLLQEALRPLMETIHLRIQEQELKAVVTNRNHPEKIFLDLIQEIVKSNRKFH